MAYFQEFVNAYDRATSARSRVMAIDRVIHQFHYSLRDQPEQPTRAAGVNLIAGTLDVVVAFLDRLSGLDLPAEMTATGDEWRNNQALASAPWFARRQE